MPGELIKSKSGFIATVVTVLGGQAGCAALALVTEVCYARLLGPAGRGQISLCMMVISMGALIGGLGGDVPIVIWTANPKEKLSDWLPATLLWGVMGCVLANGLWALTYWIWRPSWLHDVTSPLAIIILATIPFTVLGGYFTAILAGADRFRSRAGVALADQAAGVIGFVALMALWGQKPEMAMLGNLIGLALGLGLAVSLIRDSFPHTWGLHWPDEKILAGFRMGLRGQLGSFASLLFYRLDFFFINFFLGPAQVGLYALGVAVSEALWQVPSAVASALFPRTARTTGNGADEFTCLIMRQVCAISCAMGLLLAIVCPFGIPLIFGERFRPSISVVWWILPGTIALSLAKVACADLAGRYKNGYSTLCATAALVVTIALDWVLIPRLGIRGAALASSAAYITDGGLLLVALKYELKASWKTLLVPSPSEFGTYWNVWLRYWPWSRPATAPTADTGGVP